MFSSGLLSVDQIDPQRLIPFFKRVKKAAATSNSLRSRVGALVFFEASTRTRLSFEKAGLDLGMRWLRLEAQESSLQKKESRRDTLEVLQAQGVDLLVIRDAHSGSAHFAHKWTGLPVINAGDGMREHPTQALLDAYTLWEADPKKKWQIVFFGDAFRSRVIRSNCPLFQKLGYRLSLVDDESDETKRFSRAFKLRLVSRKSLRRAEVVYGLRVQGERGSEAHQRPLSEDDLGKKTLLMHPGPAVEGVDLTPSLASRDFKNSLIHQQRLNGVRVRRQLLQEVLS